MRNLELATPTSHNSDQLRNIRCPFSAHWFGVAHSWPLLTGPTGPTCSWQLQKWRFPNRILLLHSRFRGCICVWFSRARNSFWWNVWTKSDDDFFMATTSGSIYMNPFINPNALAMAGVFTVYSWNVHGTIPTYWFYIDPLRSYLLVSIPSILTLRYMKTPKQKAVLWE